MRVSCDERRVSGRSGSSRINKALTDAAVRRQRRSHRSTRRRWPVVRDYSEARDPGRLWDGGTVNTSPNDLHSKPPFRIHIPLHM